MRIAVAAVALFAASVAHATSVVPLTDEQLAAGASSVVVGTVIDVQAATHDIGPGVFTEYVVAVEEVLLGAPAEELVIRVPGGAAGDYRTVVPGMPAMRMGERVVLFLEPLPTAPFGDARPAWIPFGLEQGVWREEGGRWIRGDQEGLLPTTTGPPPVVPRTLDELRTLVAPVIP